MTALQGEMCSRVVVEGGGDPALGAVAVRARRLPALGKLAVMSVFVTILTDLRCALKLHLFLAHGDFVTGAALHGAVRSKQWKFGFGMVESVHVGP